MAHSQWKYTDTTVIDVQNISFPNQLPKISKDSTDAEITAHVKAMNEWIIKEHYESNYTSPLIYAETALYLASKASDKSLLHETRSKLGNVMLRVKDTANAKALFLKSLEYAIIDNDSTVILSCKGNLANAYYYTGGYKHKAISANLEGIEIAKRIKDTVRTFIMHHNVARIYLENEDIKNSQFHIAESARYLPYLDNPFYESRQLRNEGMLNVLLDKPDEAIDKLKVSIEIADSKDFRDGLIEGYEGYIKALELKKDYKGIYDINKKLKVYSDKKKEEEENQAIEVITAKINVQRYKEQIKSKVLEKELLEQQADSKSLLLVIVFGILVFLLVILFINYVSFKKRKVLIKTLRNKNTQYLEAKKQSDELTKSKSRFFATVSHELRTPLYGVIGLSSILLENNELKKHENDLNSLKFSADYLLALINDLLQMNKIDNDGFRDEETTFNVKNLVQTIVSSFEYIRLQHQNEIHISVEENLPELLKGNSMRLSQILMNLIGNACKFTEKGVINVNVNNLSLLDGKAKLKFEINDTGPGIAENKLSQVFKEFAQIDSSGGKYQGTGLGLPIVKKLVDQAGGTINVESEIGKGTTFVFVLEFAIALDSEGPTVIPLFDVKKLSEKHILIVEDNRINQIVTKRILETENVLCSIAHNGEEAVSMVKQNTYDLILMDINMPLKNGIEATREIRTFNHIVPIIALTAVEVDEQKQEILECGMNDIIVKPYDMYIFKNTIIANLSSKKHEFPFTN